MYNKAQLDTFGTGFKTRLIGSEIRNLLIPLFGGDFVPLFAPEYIVFPLIGIAIENK